MKPLRSACFAIPVIVLGALAAPSALADANFNNATGDYLWFNPLNWSGNTLPLPSDWTYINNSAMAADKKTSETSPAILHSATETADVTFLHLGWGAGDSGWLDVQSDLNALASTVANSQNAQGGLRFSGGAVSLYFPPRRTLVTIRQAQNRSKERQTHETSIRHSLVRNRLSRRSTPVGAGLSANRDQQHGQRDQQRRRRRSGDGGA
ncbi:MAG: hypothetical protein ACOX5G_13175 [Kiritimatiellia bacterium]